MQTLHCGGCADIATDIVYTARFYTSYGFHTSLCLCIVVHDCNITPRDGVPAASADGTCSLPHGGLRRRHWHAEGGRGQGKSDVSCHPFNGTSTAGSQLIGRVSLCLLRSGRGAWSLQRTQPGSNYSVGLCLAAHHSSAWEQAMVDRRASQRGPPCWSLCATRRYTQAQHQRQARPACCSPYRRSQQPHTAAMYVTASPTRYETLPNSARRCEHQPASAICAGELSIARQPHDPSTTLASDTLLILHSTSY